MNQRDDDRLDEAWESRELGSDPNHVAVSTPERQQAVLDHLGLQMISIRLQRGLVEGLKMIASMRGIGYQPMIRDILTRFAINEVKALEHELQAAQRRGGIEVPSEPAPKAACGGTAG